VDRGARGVELGAQEGAHLLAELGVPGPEQRVARQVDDGAHRTCA
jgi:hypothetical protein